MGSFPSPEPVRDLASATPIPADRAIRQSHAFRLSCHQLPIARIDCWPVRAFSQSTWIRTEERVRESSWEISCCVLWAAISARTWARRAVMVNSSSSLIFLESFLVRLPHMSFADTSMLERKEGSPDLRGVA